MINKALEQVNNGDFVFCCDSGAFFFRDVRNLTASMNNSDVWLSVRSTIDKQWTKPQVFELLNAQDESITNSQQINASFILVRS